MFPFRPVALICSFVALSLSAQVSRAADTPPVAVPSVIPLNTNWQIQSSCEEKAVGEQISAAGFAATGWHKATVPNTVVGTLVDDKTYPDPTYGTNLNNLPGMNYSSATFFALQDMQEGSPFKCSWWWRKEFSVPSAFAKKNIIIHFPGINYRANVWFNGQKIDDAAAIAGTYRNLEFDLTKLAKPVEE